ncbi:Oxidative stress-induced growth inhibitor 1, partial [Gryllus bimaculatus]
MRDYAVARAVPDHAVRTEVVVVGNGPSALSLSQLLAGWEPSLAASPPPPGAHAHAHPDELLEARLRSAPPAQSLLEQDLRALAQGRARTPLALLLDALERPGADAGLERPSLLRWRLRRERAVDHVVLGKGPPGGAWQTMDGSILTLSLASWMELPGLSFRAWESGAGDAGGGGGGGRGGGGGGRGVLRRRAWPLLRRLRGCARPIARYIRSAAS